MAIELAPYWCLLTARGECIAALELPGYTRTLALPGDFEVTSCSDTKGFYREVAALAAEWQCPRLAAALVVDLAERMDVDALGEVRATPYLRSLLDSRLPPGCDTHDPPWEAFSGGIRGTIRSTEVTFSELFERAIILSAKSTSQQHEQRARTMRALEGSLDGIRFDRKPFRACISELCRAAAVEDHTDWTGLREHVDPDCPISLERGCVPLRVVMQSTLFAAGQGQLRLRVLDDGIAISWSAD